MTLLVVNQEIDMKKSIVIAMCSLPLIFSSAVYAQSSAPQGGEAPAPGAPAPMPGMPAPSNTAPPAPPAPGKAASGADTANSAAMTEAITGWSVKDRSAEHTSELQSLMPISYTVFCLKKKNNQHE